MVATTVSYILLWGHSRQAIQFPLWVLRSATRYIRGSSPQRLLPVGLARRAHAECRQAAVRFRDGHWLEWRLYEVLRLLDFDDPTGAVSATWYHFDFWDKHNKRTGSWIRKRRLSGTSVRGSSHLPSQQAAGAPTSKFLRVALTDGRAVVRGNMAHRDRNQIEKLLALTFTFNARLIAVQTKQAQMTEALLVAVI